MKSVTDILNDGAQTYEKKNEDYGRSWERIGHILYQLAGEEPVTLESPEDWIAAGLFTRRLDKFARSFNGEFLTDDLNFESAIDADEDESVYAAMQASNKAARTPDGEDNIKEALNADRSEAEGVSKGDKDVDLGDYEIDPTFNYECRCGWAGNKDQMNKYCDYYECPECYRILMQQTDE